MPQYPTWWIWLAAALLLAVGLALHPTGFIAAIVLSAGQRWAAWAASVNQKHELQPAKFIPGVPNAIWPDWNAGWSESPRASVE